MSRSTVPRLQELPSAEEFASQVERRNRPVVYEGCVSNWSACTNWCPGNGGLEYLKSIAGGASVQAMLSNSGSNFFGDIRSHERVSMSFGGFLDFASQPNRGSEAELQAADDMQSHLPAGSQLYLAQAPIYDKERQEPCSLTALLQDVSMPKFLNFDAVTNINLWMSVSDSKSSTHYDPFHNILCVVAGRKQVILWPPTATPFLYPFPVHGEASNHSAVNFVKPDAHMHPLFERASKCCQVVVLRCGDALFIPEGWYHQVNSDRLTIAVNIWWPSEISLAMNSHMDAYYLRRIVGSLLDREKDQMIEMAMVCGKDMGESRQHNSMLDEKCPFLEQRIVEPTAEKSMLIMHTSGISDKGNSCSKLDCKELERWSAFELLTPLQKECLQGLVLYVMSVEEEPHVANKVLLDDVKHDQGLGMPEAPTSKYPASYQHQSLNFQIRKSVISVTEKDAVARFLGILDPSSLKQLLLFMVNHFPRTLEALILRGLSPLAAELLTRKFDEMDRIVSESEQVEFYKLFYSVFEDPKGAMSVLLDAKESFSALALRSTLESYLGFSSNPL